jgi:hypothetical protein
MKEMRERKHKRMPHPLADLVWLMIQGLKLQDWVDYLGCIPVVLVLTELWNS